MQAAKRASNKEILEKVSEYPGDKVKLAITDIDGILRGKYVHKQKFLSALDDGFGFCDVVFGWDANDSCYEGIDYTGWHTGYPDAKAKIDLQTFRQTPWDNDVPFFLADFCDDSDQGLAVCPRSLLKSIREQAATMGYRACFSQEYEWFNFKESPDDMQRKAYVQPNPISPGMYGYSILRASRHADYFNDIFDQLTQFSIPLEGLHTETGPGVYEAAILHTEILEAADRAVLLKTSVKEIAMRHGILPSFMAKWHVNYPGCSGHIHQSLWSLQDDKNVFYDGAGNRISDVMEKYLAGLLHCLPVVLPMYAPTINSYKRLVEGTWAPTTVTWGVDNRTTAARVLLGSENSTRIEFRVPGSDVNAYLAMAACLASGLYGIKNNLDLKTEQTKGNGYTDKNGDVLARTLHEATDLMKNSEVANELFGEAFVRHFTQTRDWEWKQHLKAITDWELQRYFEII